MVANRSDRFVDFFRFWCSRGGRSRGGRGVADRLAGLAAFFAIVAGLGMVVVVLPFFFVSLDFEGSSGLAAFLAFLDFEGSFGLAF